MALLDKKIHRDAKSARRQYRIHPIKDGVLTPVILAKGTTATKFKITQAFEYALGGHIRTKAAADEIVFSAIHATGIAKWMHILVMIDADGNVTTKSNPNTGDQDAATEAAALAAVPAADAGKLAIGIMTLLTNAADWDANTDALDSADLLAANFGGFNGDRRLATVKPGWRHEITAVRTRCRAASGVAYLEVRVVPVGFTGVLTQSRLEVDRRTVANTTVIKLRVADFDYAIDGVHYHKAAATAIVFTAAHAVSLDKWGAILVQINAAGTVSTKVVATPQAYTRESTARAAIPAPDAGNAAIGYIVIEAKNALWTANTDDLVAASDLEAVDILPVTHDRLISSPVLALDAAEKEDFKVAAFDYIIDGVKYSKALAIGIDFTAAHVATASKYLAILVEINAAGTVATKVPLIDGRSQTTTQGFDTPSLAIAALPPVTPGKVALGYILVLADAGGWTANTDDMETGGADLTSCQFVSYEAPLNEVHAVQAAAFTSETFVESTLATRTAARRGDPDASILALFGGTTGVVTEAEAMVEVRPYPMSGDVI